MTRNINLKIKKIIEIFFLNFVYISFFLTFIFSFTAFANSHESNLEIQEINETFNKDLMDMQDYYMSAIRVDEICKGVFQKEIEFTDIIVNRNYEEYLKIVKSQHFNSLLLANWYVKQKYSEETYEAFYWSNEKRIRELMFQNILFYSNKHSEFFEKEKASGKDDMQSFLGACNSFKNNSLIFWN